MFKNSNYKEKLSSDSKILYAFLLDRLKLSDKNHWIDLEKNIYLIFTRQEVQDKLNLSEKTVIKAFKQLSNVGLIYEKRQGLGKPNLIYVGKIQHDEYMDDTNLKNIQLQNCNFYSSKDGNNTVLDMENFVSAEHYKYLENEIDEILWQIAGYSEHWDKLFYKFGLIDGINLDKELKKELEDKLNGKSIK